MPELPEVETVCLALSKIVNNAKIEDIDILRSDLRWKIKKSLKNDLENDCFRQPFRRGKYILIPTIKDNIFLIHLGMSGQIKITNKFESLLKHDHVRITIKSKNNKMYIITYNDPRRFGYIDLFHKKEINQHFLLKKLGVEPFEKKLNVGYLQTIFDKKIKCIKDTLMDQSVIAGIGNIYSSEILFRAKINPYRSVKTLKKEEIKSIIRATREILKKSINAGGTTLQNHLQPNGKLGYFFQNLEVYGKKNKICNKCKSSISVTIISNRSTFFCNYCQI
ncbi:bifunctional DNA-formamidopyrimidine glycosylase/DNA-(apurinic or apyrimidinic site) lyase [Alphaproteobacteria bacterium]|nr:bifunctional DNA-formamidopyrimidine glycosylase/DNA-(apurinic or apyrimidinic site) lyase [Alphaproteobacteria bacterium]